MQRFCSRGHTAPQTQPHNWQRCAAGVCHQLRAAQRIPAPQLASALRGSKLSVSVCLHRCPPFEQKSPYTGQAHVLRSTAQHAAAEAPRYASTQTVLRRNGRVEGAWLPICAPAVYNRLPDRLPGGALGPLPTRAPHQPRASALHTRRQAPGDFCIVAQTLSASRQPASHAPAAAHTPGGAAPRLRARGSGSGGSCPFCKPRNIHAVNLCGA